MTGVSPLASESGDEVCEVAVVVVRLSSYGSRGFSTIIVAGYRRISDSFAHVVVSYLIPNMASQMVQNSREIF